MDGMKQISLVTITSILSSASSTKLEQWTPVLPCPAWKNYQYKFPATSNSLHRGPPAPLEKCLSLVPWWIEQA
jgi:hypothetical protein